MRANKLNIWIDIEMEKADIHGVLPQYQNGKIPIARLPLSAVTLRTLADNLQPQTTCLLLGNFPITNSFLLCKTTFTRFC